MLRSLPTVKHLRKTSKISPKGRGARRRRRKKDREKKSLTITSPSARNTADVTLRRSVGIAEEVPKKVNCS
jgi:hypothetical protein